MLSSSASLQIKKLSDEAIVPSRGSEHAIGYDLSACMMSGQIIIKPHGMAIIPTGISMAIPIGTYGRIAPRSGLAAKKWIDVGAGVIDPDYRGEVKVILFNHHPTNEFVVNHGDRIAQLILEQAITPSVVELTKEEKLSETERMCGGFGSTGISTLVIDQDKKER